MVAVFGSMQMAMSRVINLQHHRIAQVNHPVPGEEPLTLCCLHSWRNRSRRSSRELVGFRIRMFALLSLPFVSAFVS